MENRSISVIILTKDVKETLLSTLSSLEFADEIIAIDDSSTDGTLEILKQRQVRTVAYPGTNFSDKRTEALSLASYDWIFYVDADEVVSPELARKVNEIVSAGVANAFRIRRRNIFLGTEMYPDYVDRFFHRSIISGWQGKVHESPLLTVKPNIIEESLMHFTHRNITSMLTKTNAWSEYEAELRLSANHPPVAWWRLIRIALTVWWHQFVGLRLGRFGRAGLFEGYFQIVDKLIVYTKLWERQRKTIT